MPFEPVRHLLELWVASKLIAKRKCWIKTMKLFRVSMLVGIVRAACTGIPMMRWHLVWPWHNHKHFQFHKHEEETLDLSWFWQARCIFSAHGWWHPQNLKWYLKGCVAARCQRIAWREWRNRRVKQAMLWTQCKKTGRTTCNISLNMPSQHASCATMWAHQQSRISSPCWRQT